MSKTQTIALIEGNRMRVLRHRGKGSDEIMSVTLPPLTVGQEVAAQLVYDLLTVYTAAEQQATTAVQAQQAERRKAPAKKKRQVRRRPIPTADLVAVLAERNAYGPDTAVTVSTLAEQMGVPLDQLRTKVSAPQLGKVVEYIGPAADRSVWLAQPATEAAPAA